MYQILHFFTIYFLAAVVFAFGFLAVAETDAFFTVFLGFADTAGFAFDAFATTAFGFAAVTFAFVAAGFDFMIPVFLASLAFAFSVFLFSAVFLVATAFLALGFLSAAPTAVFLEETPIFLEATFLL